MCAADTDNGIIFSILKHINWRKERVPVVVCVVFNHSMTKLRNNLSRMNEFATFDGNAKSSKSVVKQIFIAHTVRKLILIRCMVFYVLKMHTIET